MPPGGGQQQSQQSKRRRDHQSINSNIQWFRPLPHTNTQPAGLIGPVLTLSRSASYQFTGGVAGAVPCTSTVACATQGFTALYSTDNVALWEVCPARFALTTCVIGGNPVLGTIGQTGLYTAPAEIPNPQPVILVTSQLSRTITNQSNYAYVEAAWQHKGPPYRRPFLFKPAPEPYFGTGFGSGLVLLSMNLCCDSSTLLRANDASRQPLISTRLPSRSL